MAHIVVYLQRTPHGLHPGSAVAACWARDIGTQRGASITGYCSGDAGPVDRGILAAAGRFGVDTVVFGGPTGLQNLAERLNPTHILVPFTESGIQISANVRGGPLVPRHIESESPALTSADALTGVVAGVLPWHSFSLLLEAEYEGDVEQSPLPGWVADAEPDGVAPIFELVAPGPLGVIGRDAAPIKTQQRLDALGATPVGIDAIAQAEAGTFLFLAPAAGPIPALVAARGPRTRLIVLPGPDAELDPSWSNADMVLRGAWPDVLDELRDGPWETANG